MENRNLNLSQNQKDLLNINPHHNLIKKLVLHLETKKDRQDPDQEINQNLKLLLSLEEEVLKK